MSPRSRSPRPVLFSDLDGTLWREMLHSLLMEECFILGIFDGEAEKKYRDAYLARRDRRISYDQYEGELIEFMLEQMTGMPTSHIERAAASLATRHKDYVYTFTATLLQMTATTHERVAITGAIREIANIVGADRGFDYTYGTHMERHESAYTGKQLHVPPLDKGAVVQDHCTATGASPLGSIAIGDTGSDISMLAHVEYPIAFNPNEALAREATRRGWPKVNERKEVVYVMIGDTCREFYVEQPGQAEEAVRYALKR